MAVCGGQRVQQLAQGFLHGQRCRDLTGRVPAVEQPLEPVPLLVGKVPGAAKQQPAVGPRVVGLGTAMPEALLGDPVADLSDHQVRRLVHVPMVDHELGVGQGRAQCCGERCARVDRDHGDAVAELL